MNDGRTVCPVCLVVTVTAKEFGSVIVGSVKDVTEFTSALKLKGVEVQVRVGGPPILRLYEYGT
jgi:hypothetical protein